MGVRETRGCLELLAKLLGELDERPQVNLLLAPEWRTVRGALLAALAGFPEARAAVARQLLALEAGDEPSRGSGTRARPRPARRGGRHDARSVAGPAAAVPGAALP